MAIGVMLVGYIEPIIGLMPIGSIEPIIGFMLTTGFIDIVGIGIDGIGMGIGIETVFMVAPG
jgi:hypothetical protein